MCTGRPAAADHDNIQAAACACPAVTGSLSAYLALLSKRHSHGHVRFELPASYRSSWARYLLATVTKCRLRTQNCFAKNSHAQPPLRLYLRPSQEPNKAVLCKNKQLFRNKSSSAPRTYARQSALVNCGARWKILKASGVDFQ
jgi:hypothetical protein